jgi:nitroreductase
VRKFKKQDVPQDLVEQILEAGRWAPSGLNNQPWRFLVLSKDSKDGLAQHTHYSAIIKGADKVILVFLDQEASYHRDKDMMALGAAIQNMLLAIHAFGLGACWLGEILKSKDEIHRQLNLQKGIELSAVIALGFPAGPVAKGKRTPLTQLVIEQ